MPKKFHEIYDIELFKSKSLYELSSIWNVSVDFLRTYRKKYFPEMTRKITKIDMNLLEDRLKNYLILISSKNELVNISYFCDMFDYPNPYISKYLVKLIAEKYKISINFPELNKYEHSYSNYARKLCSCDLCKLCNSIYQKYKLQKKYIPNSVISELALKYYDLYKVDNSRYKRIFYTKIDEELKLKESKE